MGGGGSQTFFADAIRVAAIGLDQYHSDMTDFIRRNAMLILFVVLCGSSSVRMIWDVSSLGDSLSWVDPGSEANVLREVRNFLEEGVGKHYGLGNLNYPGMYDDAGIVLSYLDNPESDRSETAYVREHVVNPDGVYTHYPPGPEYLVYAAARVVGLKPVWRLRLLPIAVGFAATLFLTMAVCRRFSTEAGLIVATALVLTPSVTSGFIGLHDQGFTLGLTMVEIGITLASGRRLAPLAIVGFLQGWLSFDHVCLVAFIPLSAPVERWAVAHCHGRQRVRGRPRTAFSRGLCLFRLGPGRADRSRQRSGLSIRCDCLGQFY